MEGQVELGNFFAHWKPQKQSGHLSNQDTTLKKKSTMRWLGHDGYAEAESRRPASEMTLPSLTTGQKCNGA